MTLIAEPPIWPADPEDRWGECGRPVDLLDSVEQIIGTLPRGFEQMRSRCRRLSDRASGQ